MLDRLAAVGQSRVRVRTLGGNRAGEMRITRFLRNPRVTPAEMVQTAAARTAKLVAGRHILAIQDTTSLRDDGDQQSLVLHPTMQRKARPFAQKESRRWLTATEQAGALLAAGAACLTVIADREGDIYEEFAGKPAGVELLIRVGQDRVLADGRRLFACTEGLPELGRLTVALPAAPGRAARQAVLGLRACPVRIARPKRPAAQAAGLPPEVSLTLVEAHEIDPPEGAAAAHWRLLTTHRVTSLAEATLMVGFYRQRWTIEQLFRVMKTKGFDIEAVRIAEDEPFEKLATATLIAALQVLQLVRDRDGTARRPFADVFDPADQPAMAAICATLEGKTQRQQNPHPSASLAYAAWVCARLGGWTGYYGKPGPMVTLNGLLRFKAMAHGWNLGRLV